MKIVLTRVKEASVKVNNEVVGSIDKGLLLLVGFTEGDSLDTIQYMANKVLNLRVFDDSNGIMNLSVRDINGKILSVSQFTLYGDASKGNRPSYSKALNQEKAKVLYEQFNRLLSKKIEIQTGIFRTDMDVYSINDGPVTIVLEK